MKIIIIELLFLRDFKQLLVRALGGQHGMVKLNFLIDSYILLLMNLYEGEVLLTGDDPFLVSVYLELLRTYGVDRSTRSWVEVLVDDHLNEFKQALWRSVPKDYNDHMVYIKSLDNTSIVIECRPRRSSLVTPKVRGWE